MSWIFGYHGNVDNKYSFQHVPLHSTTNKNFALLCGGNVQTTFYKQDHNSNGWVVVGVGLISIGSKYKIMNSTDWENVLSSASVGLGNINGHYVVIKYNDEQINIYTDPFGIRDIYFIKEKSGFGFTTRVDWIKYFIKPELDLTQFGSRWLLYNQISDESIFKNITRVAGKNAEIKNGKLTTIGSTLIKQNDTENQFSFIETLNKFVCNSEKKISLSLSGGVDSRFLLSILLASKNKNWDTHTFGSPNQPDAVIANLISNKLKFDHKTIHTEIPDRDDLIELFKDYSASTMVTNVASSILNLRFYNYFSDEIIIDGGFGEIWRKQFANKLRFLGRKAIKNKNRNKIFDLLYQQKSDFFNQDVLIEMKKGPTDQIEKILHELPDTKNNITVNEWVDLFSIKTRLKNYYAPEQSRMDNYVTSFMPLAQKDLLAQFFSPGLKQTIGYEQFKKIIRENYSELAKFPFVKGNIKVSFNSSAIRVRIYSRINNKFGRRYFDNEKIAAFNLLKEFIQDRLNSKNVQSFEMYDKIKLQRIGREFNLNPGNYAKVDWFLAFELFKESAF